MTRHLNRRITAIFLADVSGYSRLMAASEERTLAHLNEHRHIITAQLAAHGGRLIDTAGDSVLAEFASPLSAVECAIVIQKELQARNAERPENQRMEFRIGINLSEVLVEGERIYGDGVNVAARLEGLAEPGGIAISASVHDQVARKLGSVAFENNGRHRVKNIPYPIQVYSIRLDTRAQPCLPARVPRSARHAALVASTLLLAALGFLLLPRQQQGLNIPDVDPYSVKTIRDCPGCPELALIPGGHFIMGSGEREKGHRSEEGPQRGVTIRSVLIGRYEVTFAQWDACVSDQGCKHSPNDRGWGRGTRPVIYVSWHDAHQLLAWLSLKSGKRYRLPSEAEWEFAARAGSTGRFWWGDMPGEKLSNCIDCAGADSSRTMPVGSFRANAFGLYDVHGNVAEWTADCWNGSYAGAPNDGSVWLVGECSKRVVRGGAWGLRSDEMRAAHRRGDPADLRSGRRGIRVARDP
jgi:formylglycine-generating enzyme required for sulfatase activity/class 3 adenylate cyclase